MKPRDPLRLTAPWYRWQRQYDRPLPGAGPLPRESRPVFQMFDGADFVKRFLANPQRSLVFDPVKDRVSIVEESPYVKRFRGIRHLSGKGLSQCDLRKLYRDVHSRFYVVVCELHCHAPGLPDAKPGRLVERGFVVRRRRLGDPRAHDDERARLDGLIADTKAALLRIDGKDDGVRFPVEWLDWIRRSLPLGRRRMHAHAREEREEDEMLRALGLREQGPDVESVREFESGFGFGVTDAPAVGAGGSGRSADRTLAETMGETLGIVEKGGLDLHTFAGASPRSAFDDIALAPVARPRHYYLRRLFKLRAERAALEENRAPASRYALERWVPNEDREAMGAWKALTAETPDEIGDEQVLPLYPLVPDPADTDHSSIGTDRDGVARGASLLFGVVPSGSRSTTLTGEPQFDSVHTYEIRCFVRDAPRELETPRGTIDCPSPLVWSQATEPYRLAPYDDLFGATNAPIAIEAPDVPALTAQAAVLPPGAGAPVGTRFPDGSGLDMGGASLVLPGGGPLGGGRMCFEPIPLVTIVAKFLYNLIKGIVVYIFSLYPLLALEFCLGGGFGALADAASSLNQALQDALPDLPDDLTLATLDLEVLTSAQIAELNASAALGLEVQAEISKFLGPQGDVVSQSIHQKTPPTPGEDLAQEFDTFELLQQLKALASPKTPDFGPESLVFEDVLRERPHVSEFTRSLEVA